MNLIYLTGLIEIRMYVRVISQTFGGFYVFSRLLLASIVV